MSTRYFITGTNVNTNKRVAIMRNDIERVMINSCLVFIYFKNREKLILKSNDGKYVMLPTEDYFEYKKSCGNVHTMSIAFNS